MGLNTIPEKDEIIEGTYDGRQFRYRALKTFDGGSMSYYGSAVDELNGKKVFLKKYIDPASRSSWFQEYIQYQEKIYRNFSISAEAQKIVAKASFFLHEKKFWQEIEYIENSMDLKKYLTSEDTTWEQRKTFACVFMYAMKILHEQVKLIHGDLKPENILLIPTAKEGQYQVKLIDFDRPILMEEGEVPWKDSGYEGTPGYFSPEHQRGECPTDKSDVFTCGLILYELLAKGGHPYNMESELPILEAYGAPIPELYGSFGSAGKDERVATMLHRMLDPNPVNRPTAAEVHQCLVSRAAGPRAAETAVPVIIPKTECASQVPQAGAADIVFLLDATSSMGNCFNALKARLHDFIHDLFVGNPENGVMPVTDWRARVVGYRDFTDCNKKSIRNYKKCGGGGWFIASPFTRSEEELYNQVNNLKAFGGGESPDESLLDALMLTINSGKLQRGVKDAPDERQGYAWRLDGVAKVIIIFTDAGYHKNMAYCNENTLTEEKEVYPMDLRGCGLDEIENGIESLHCKLFVYAPHIQDYEEFAELNGVTVWFTEDNSTDTGLVSNIQDQTKFSKLLQSIARGISQSAMAELKL